MCQKPDTPKLIKQLGSTLASYNPDFLFAFKLEILCSSHPLITLAIHSKKCAFDCQNKVQDLSEKLLNDPARPNVWESKWRPNLDFQGHPSLEVRRVKTFKCLFSREWQFYLLTWRIYTETPTVTKHNNNTLMREKGWYLMTLRARCRFTPFCCCVCVCGTGRKCKH